MSEMELDDDIVMPVMAPVLIRSDIPELQGQVDSRVLVCVDLTWKEYLYMFNIELHSEEYVVKGNGREFCIDNKIGDYINSFKRKLKVHPVTIEKLKKPKVPKPVSPTPPVNAPPSGRKRGPKKKNGPATDKTETPKAPKRTRGSEDKIPVESSVMEVNVSPLDSLAVNSTEVELKNPRSPVTTSTNATTVDSVIPWDQTESIPPTKQGNKLGVKSNDVSKINSSEISLESKRLNTETSPKSINSTLHTSESTEGLSNGALHHNVKEVVDPSISSSMPKPLLRTIKNDKRNRFGARDRDFGGEQFDIDSSEEESLSAKNSYRCNLTTPHKLDLKQPLMHFLATKVSNRDMLKVREELMKLKEQDNYFKVTSLTPLTAGLLDQMLCRSLPRTT